MSKDILRVVIATIVFFLLIWWLTSIPTCDRPANMVSARTLAKCAGIMESAR